MKLRNLVSKTMYAGLLGLSGLLGAETALADDAEATAWNDPTFAAEQLKQEMAQSEAPTTPNPQATTPEDTQSTPDAPTPVTLFPMLPGVTASALSGNYTSAYADALIPLIGSQRNFFHIDTAGLYSITDNAYSGSFGMGQRVLTD